MTLLGALLTGCATQASITPIERQDEATGMTYAAMARPLAFVEKGIFDLLGPEKQSSYVYLGPVEWDRAGAITYLLWVQMAPGVGGHRIGDLREPGTLRLQLDDGSVVLSAVTIPVAEPGPYRPIAPVGQLTYFAADEALLRRIAASPTLALKVRSADLTVVDFAPIQETRVALERFILERGIAKN
jgi:hypothetical protein